MKRLLLLAALLLLRVGTWGQGCVGTCNVEGSITVGGVTGGATLVSVDVLPPTAAVPVGSSVSFAALATFSDGSTSDVSDQATWQVAPPGITTNSGGQVSCNFIPGGIVTVSAQVQAISGSATLNCQNYRISPSGDLTAYLGVPFSQQFSELGGTPPYNWSSAGILPPGLTFTTGVSGGLLSGTPLILGDYLFTVSDQDSSVPPITDNEGMTVHVVAQPTEDSRYCLPNETITNLFADGPAQPMQNCNYTAVAGTPTGSQGIRYVCPPTQRTSAGDPIGGCLNAESNAHTDYFNSVQHAMSGCGGATPCANGATIQAAACGTWIQIYAANPESLPGGGTGPQNIFNENDTIPPTNCFNDSHGWPWVTTKSYSSLPAPGTRITPAWFGQTSIPGRPAYQQPATPGIYGPMIRCVGGNAPGTPCQSLTTPASSAAASGWRFIGIEFTAPRGREPSGGSPAGYPNVAVCPPNFNGTPQCDPGFVSPVVSLGCTGATSNSSCGVTGASHIILDRLWIHGCDDKSSIACKGQSREGLELQGGRHNSIIDSYINDFKTMIGVGPSVEAHGIGGGNVKNTGDDFGTKIVNNFIEGSSVGLFQGGGASTTGVYTNDIEIRRNTFFKPLLWKIDDPSFPLMGGSVYDAWVQNKGSGYSNDPGTNCAIEAPTGPNPVQATCTAHVAGGQLLDVTITNTGSGYIQNPKFTFGSPASLNNADDTLTGWSTCVIGNCSGGGTPGGSGVPQAFSQTINNAVSGFGDGASMAMSLTSSASVAQTNALWTQKTQHDAPTDTNLTSFTLDLDVEASASCADAGQFEFDQFLFSLPESTNYMFGTQCNKTSGVWQVWNQLAGTWVNSSPSIACNFTCSVPHHLTEKVHRVIGDTGCSGHACLIYDSITWDGVTSTLNQSLPSGPLSGGFTSAVGFQEQINIPGLNKTVTLYSDHTNFVAQSGNGKAQAFGLIGTYNIKNHIEFKNGRRVLLEGNRMANVWKGQSDQDANTILLGPKNAGDCLTCTVTDVTLRYGLSQGSNRAMNVGAVVDTRCGVNQTSNITSISESGNTVTVVVADVIVSKIQIGATADIAGVPVDTAYNGSFTILTINNAGKTFTYTNPTAGLGARTGGTAAFTPPVCLSDGLFRASIHDMLFDGVNPILWLSKKQAFDGFGGSCFSLGNGNPQDSIAQDVDFNHVGCITTSPAGAGSSSLASTLSMTEGCQNSTAVFPGLKFRNSYGAGGVKAPGTIGQGCPNCSGLNCTGGSTTALSMVAASDHLLPVAGGFYTTGQVMRGIVDIGGTCTVAPTGVTFNGGGFTVQATGGLVFQNGTVTAVTVKTVGAGYTSAPTVAFVGGTCSVTPTGHTLLGGQTGVPQSKAWCFDHNVIPQAAYNGEVPMTPYPTTQGDPTNNTCSSHGGGGNISVNAWTDMLFTNLPLDVSGSEIPTGDLRLLGGSPGKNAASDGLDVGPNIDLINQYTGCSISNGVTVCP